MSHYSSTDVVGERMMREVPPQDPAARPVMRGEKCACCPYGFHIDVDFVKYAENVASGQYRQHLRQMRRAKKKLRRSMEQYQIDDAVRSKQTGQHLAPVGAGGEDAAKVDRSLVLSPMESIFSDSLENIMSDFEEALHPYDSSSLQHSRAKNYSSDVEFATSPRYRAARGDGYMSDNYGYASPQLIRRLPPPPPPPRSGYSAANLARARLSFDDRGFSNVQRPARLSLGVGTGRNVSFDDRHHNSAEAADLSDSMSSLGSVSLTPNGGVGLPQYRGISGQIAANMDSLASALEKSKTSPDSAQVVRAFRDQVALSLDHMRDLEAQVENIPRLNSRISSLKQEKRLLSSDLEQKRYPSAPAKPPQKPSPPPVPPKPSSPSEASVVVETSQNYSTAVARAMSQVKKVDVVEAKQQQQQKEQKKVILESEESARTQSPAPPPPVPPKPAYRASKQAADSAVTNLPPLLRTPSGNVMNLDSFQSFRRTSSSTSSSHRRNNLAGRDDDDAVSDSELALGESATMRATWRGGRRLFGAREPSSSASAATALRDSTQSDTEDYDVSPRRNYSISTSAICRPGALSSLTPSAQASSSDFFKDQVSRWRQELQQTTTTLQSAPIQTVPYVCKRNKSTSTDQPPTTASIATMASIEPEKHITETRLEIKAACEVCDLRNSVGGRTSVGVGTGPLAPVEAEPCVECSHLKERLVEASARPLMMTQETATSGGDTNLHHQCVGTDVRRHSFGVMVAIGDARPETAAVETNTEVNTFEIGIGTERHLSTDAATDARAVHTGDAACAAVDSAFLYDHGHLKDAACSANSVATTSIAMNTESAGVVESVDSSTITDLDLDALLTQLQNTSQKPLCCSAAVNTDSVITMDGFTDAEAIVESTTSGTNTDIVSAADASTATDAAQFHDAGVVTDSVDIREAVESRCCAAQTDKATSRSVFVATTSVDTLSKATDTGVRTRDAGTTPIKSMSMSSSLASIGTSESAPSTAAINNVGVKVSMKDGDTQTDTDSDVPQEPRVLNDSEIADSLWLMPERQVSTAEVAVGDDTVDFVECERCVHSQQTFTRNVGVGVCAVGDRVCINCDRQSSVSSEAENVDENEPPGFCSDDIRRKSTEKPVSLRRMSEGSASPACSDASIADERPRSNSEVVESFTSSAAESQEEEVKPARPKKIDMSKPKVTRAFELSRAAAAKKLLTSEKQDSPPPQFKRNTGISKSMRVEGKKGDHLAYITDQKKHKAPSPVKESPPSSPQKDAKDASQALKGKVSLKKEPPPSKVPQPVPAKIPRPKITKYGQSEQPAQTPDEEDEAVDRLTPLRSEMRALRSWPGSPKTERQRVGVQSVGGAYSNPVALDDDEDEIDSAKPADGRLVGQVVENLPGGDNGGCSSSDSEDSMSEGSYDTSDNVITGKCDDPTATQPLAFELTAPLKEACDVLNKHLLDVNADISNDKQEWAVKYLQHEWLKAAARRNASAVFVEMFLDTLEGFSKELLVKVVNLCDQNENTALHYAVSHGNFDVVSQLLDSKVCNLNRANKAGYTPVMLAALCPIRNDTEMMVVQRLFQMGDVNVKATQHGQTALMLAASHGKAETAKLLVEAGAGVNIQDEDGSTALMCAAEHGHKDVVKLLLASPEVDASLTDYDSSSTALSIAVENGHRDIGVLIYAHLNYGRGNGQSSLTASQVAVPPVVANGSTATSIKTV